MSEWKANLLHLPDPRMVQFNVVDFYFPVVVLILGRNTLSEEYIRCNLTVIIYSMNRGKPRMQLQMVTVVDDDVVVFEVVF